MNRKTPKEVIEKGNKGTEQMYVKFPREEPVKISLEEDEKEGEVIGNLNISGQSKKFYKMHTHIYRKGKGAVALPSPTDLSAIHNHFENMDKFKGEIIAQRDYDSGEVQGYTVLLNGKKNIWGGLMENKKFLGLFKTNKKITYADLMNKYNKELNQYNSNALISPILGYDKLKEICDEHDWRLRFVPEKGYHFNKRTGNFEKNKNASLEKTVASIIGISLLLFSLFNVVNINGFVINNSRNVGSINLFWALATIVLGIVFFVVRRVKKFK